MPYAKGTILQKNSFLSSIAVGKNSIDVRVGVGSGVGKGVGKGVGLLMQYQSLGEESQSDLHNAQSLHAWVLDHVRE